MTEAKRQYRRTMYGPHTDTQVYILWMERTSFYKVGISKDVNKRLGTIQNGNPVRIKISWTSPYITRKEALAVENSARWGLRMNRSHAPRQREWFELPDGYVYELQSTLLSEIRRLRKLRVKD